MNVDRRPAWYAKMVRSSGIVLAVLLGMPLVFPVLDRLWPMALVLMGVLFVWWLTWYVTNRRP